MLSFRLQFKSEANMAQPKRLDEEIRDGSAPPERKEILAEACRKANEFIEFCLENKIGMFSLEGGAPAPGRITYIPPR